MNAHKHIWTRPAWRQHWYSALTYKTHAEEYSHGELVRPPLLTDMYSLRCLPKEEDGRPFGGAEG